MTFIQLDADTVLNADAIDRIDLNHMRPNTQERCIRLELRAIPGLAESRMILLRYQPELAAALLATLNPKPLQKSEALPVSPPLRVTLFNDEWDSPIENYAVGRIPCMGEYLVLWDAATSVASMFQVEKVCHEMPAAASDQVPLRPPLSARQQPETILLVSPCEAPLRLYEKPPSKAPSVSQQ